MGVDDDEQAEQVDAGCVGSGAAAPAERGTTHHLSQVSVADEREREAVLNSPLAAAIDFLPDPVFIYDKRGRILRTNVASRRLFALDAVPNFDALPYPERVALVAPRDLDGHPMPREQWHITRILRGELVTEDHPAEALITALDGREMIISYTGGPIRDEHGTLIGAVAVGRDVTVQRRREQEREQQLTATLAARAQLEAVFEAITDAIYVYDQEGRLIQSNGAAHSLNPSTTRGEYLQRPFAERIQAFQPRDADGRPVPPSEIPVRRVLRGESLTGANAVDNLMRRSSGDVVLNVSGAPVRDETGRIRGGVIVTRDVTERRRLELHTREALAAVLEMAQALVEQPVESETDTATASHGGIATASGIATARRLLDLTRRVLGCERAAIVAVEPGAEIIRPLAIMGVAGAQEQAWRGQLDGVPLALFLEPELLARLRGGEVLVLDVTPSPRREAAFGAVLVLIAPLRVGDELVGVLSLDYGPSKTDFAADERALAGATAQLAALVVERERLLQQREAARARELALAETNSRMSEFLSIASHELKTPITVIKTLLQLIERQDHEERAASAASVDHGREVVLDAEQGGEPSPARLLPRALSQVERLIRLVNDMLDVSRIREGKMELRVERCDLVALVADVVEGQRQTHPRRAIRLTPSTQAPVMVRADPDRIAQVVINYLTNALRYSPADRPVEVTVGVAAGESDEGETRVEQVSRVAQVVVRDLGPGIAPDQQPHIWEPFRRATGVSVQSGSGIGLGLGLYISRQIVERHAGAVGVESVPGRGSAFSFTLPLADASGE